MTATPILELRGVSKSYGAGSKTTEVLKDVNLEIEDGEFVAIVGFSGSGKTTLISLIAGLLEPDSGEIVVDGKTVRGAGPDRGLVFQNYSLLPWLTVYENVALAVDQLFGAWPAKRRKEWIEEHIDRVGLLPAAWKKPRELSGGMRQRVAVARALAMDPRLLLLDEPLSALDALTRGTLQREIEQIWSRERKTVILITNDVDEGLLLADRVIPLTPGPNATLGRAFDITLERPRDRTVLNHDPRFKKLRNEITRYLTGLRSTRETAAEAVDLELPPLKPAHYNIA